VTVVIPTYNYADKVERAIKSAVNQSYKPKEVIVVDDGSTDETESVVAGIIDDLQASGVPIRYIKQDNKGVANARNKGISATDAKFVCCLDADDKIQPDFLRVCIDSLERDRSLGIAYTGLEFVKGDGSRGVSDWPGKFDYDKQVEGYNQIPTCCVFRREMWSRLGGYKQRYAPDGAGAEDAEFWLRAGAYGYNARKVTELPLFTYSWETGRVSGDPNYKEVDWTVFHPWTKDERHPFASLATPQNTYSHWVRAYDRPVISVIIPVGSQHVHEVTNVLDSLEGQTERRWEAIIVDDTSDETSEELRMILKASYPYAKYVVSQNRGAGAARNAGAQAARGKFLLFVDADDWLYPEAMQSMLNEWEETGYIVYSDYVGKAYVSIEHANKLGDRLLHYSTSKGEAVIRHFSHDYDCERALRQPDKKDMYIWCLITALVPKLWHDEIGGFDESMESWEDWDYWIRMAWNGKCFTRIEEPLIVYRFYTGGRREIGLQQYESLVEYLTSKLGEGEPPMGCGCRGKKKAAQVQRVQQMITPSTVADQQGVSTMQDENMILCTYTSPNMGQHRVVGAATQTDYGYRGGGEVFYVHKADIASQRHLFAAKEESRPEIEATKAEPPAPPESIVMPEPQAVKAPPERVLQQEQPKKQPKIVPEEQEVETFDIEKLALDQIPGVTPQIASALNTMGVYTPEELGKLDSETLMSIKGVGEKRAGLIIDALVNLK
ncbi:MAG: glycosyltransferase, partial [Candidatus Thorarchaeota archaeon]|jgi:glycosyltransferase involved in cell wall biosynthesis/predicted flap endonuclease-1-like 5' DNA nuclease